MSEALDVVPVLEPGAAIIRVAMAIGTRVLEARLVSGLTAAQLQVLRLALPGCGVGFVVECLGTPKSTVTSVIDQLAASGLVSRSTDGADRRRQVIAATPRGARLLARFDADVASRVGMLVDALPRGRGDRLTTLLSRLPDPTIPLPTA